MSLTNSGGTTPGKVSPLMNAAATTPQVHDHCPTTSPAMDSPHCLQVRGTLVVVVETPAGRRAFLTLASAQRAVERAELAGHPASIVLARLEPVMVVP